MGGDEVIELPELPYSYKPHTCTKQSQYADEGVESGVAIQELGANARDRQEYAEEVIITQREVELAPVDRGFGAWSYVRLIPPFSSLPYLTKGSWQRHSRLNLSSGASQTATALSSPIISTIRSS